MGPICADRQASVNADSADKHSYRVKNTFVEIPREEAELSRGRRCWSDAADFLKVPSPLLGPAKTLPLAGASPFKGSGVPDTPSPFLHPSQFHNGEVPPLGFGYMGPGFGDDMGLPPAYAGEVDADGNIIPMDMFFGVPFEGQEITGFFQLPVLLDPSTGAYTWCLAPMDALAQVPEGAEGQGLQGDMAAMALVDGQGMMDSHDCMVTADASTDDQTGGSWSNEDHQDEGQNGWNAEGQRVEWGQEGEAGSHEEHSWSAGNDVLRHFKDAKILQTGEEWDEHADEAQNEEGWSEWQQGWRKGSGRWEQQQSWNQEKSWNDKTWRDENSWEDGQSLQPEQELDTTKNPSIDELPADNPLRKLMEGSHNEHGAEVPVAAIGPVDYTTVMLRNIPNKYTREMLVKQLNQDFRSRFDFVYLPIDFKNKCNVGYGFVNFRTTTACEEFVKKFHGVDVRKCLPGLNSRKIAEVTPARVQGLDENVRRLRTGPVMNELVHHPEWMPLLFGESGEVKPFPMPEQQSSALKPKRKIGRDDYCGRGVGMGAW